MIDGAVPKSFQTLNLESLHAIATMVAQQRDLDKVLESVVESLVAQWDLALARVWLIEPGDICETCFLKAECPDRTRCLHLVAMPPALRIQRAGKTGFNADGFYRRLPLGVRRIGSIAATGELLRLSDASEAGDWFARNDWLRREQVQSFCGYPLTFRNEILGVLAVFSRTRVNEQECSWLHAFADSAAVAIANCAGLQGNRILKNTTGTRERVFAR